MINLPRFNLSGTLSHFVANLGSLVEIRLKGNHINGVVPSNWTSLMNMKLLDLSDNNISPPLPIFTNGLKPMVEGNSLVGMKFFWFMLIELPNLLCLWLE
ncbi:hypothetical protein KIW84_035696 [Lathyrus oleraceus]|uniref:Uncharacterized protein n=1 Tax=Pisum sativum TaxID=3888 RepID=A0A9D5B126_PEA|nr:hypothetical protein KIW84_035696 [Pisum sativum]